MNKTENVALTPDEDQFDDELSFPDLVTLIRRNLGALLGGALMGGVLGLTLAFVLPAQWEGNASIRIGQLGNTGNAGNEGEVGSAIEPPLQVVDRIKNKSFKNDVLKSLGLSTDEDDANAKLFRDTLKVKLEKSRLISLSLRGKSPDEVKLHMNAVVNELKNIHVRMSESTINRWHQEQEYIEQELKEANAEVERLAKSLVGQSDSLNDRNFSQAALLSNVLIGREGELLSFHDRKRMLEERLSPERTFATDVLGRIEISQEQVFPKKSIFIIAGSVMGLLLGVLLSLRFVGSRSGVKTKS
jgi:hypothetical protein